jgi:hypothetical protein
MRTLKYHEQKLLKKVDFLQWKGDDNIREVKIVRRYRIQNREDYHKYNRLCGSITKVRLRRARGALGGGRARACASARWAARRAATHRSARVEASPTVGRAARARARPRRS